MKLRRAIIDTLRNRRFWLWQIGGAILYGIPVAIRYFTKSVYIPILTLPGFTIGHLIPSNLLEKILINAFFPGGAGGIAGETLATNYSGEPVKGKNKYLARLAGALAQTSAWSIFQYWGYLLMISGPHGAGNLFEHPIVFPLNFSLAALSIFTPTILNFARSKLKSARQKLVKRERANSNVSLNR